MSFLLQKSSDNQSSALLLWDTHKLYAPSIHCSYYSCIQLMIHVLLNYGGLTEVQISKDTERGGAHKYFIDNIKKLITQRNPKKMTNFNNKIYELKDFRVLSDYKNIEITPDDADKATTLSSDINSLLKNIFGIA